MGFHASILAGDSGEQQDREGHGLSRAAKAPKDKGFSP
jgi:hypothetical protein